MMKRINWNSEKSCLLKESRGVCFEDMVFCIERGDVLDDYMHPDQEKYPGQRVMVIRLKDYAYVVTYVENDEELFLKTIISTRKITEKYLGERYENKSVKRGKGNSQ